MMRNLAIAKPFLGWGRAIIKGFGTRAGKVI
jgi:hypothetical protein